MVAFLLTISVTALVLSPLALAFPAPVETRSLVRRTITGARAAICEGNNRYNVAEVEAAAQEATNLRLAGTTVWRYPLPFTNREGFTFPPGCNPPFFEFPISKYGVYGHGKPDGPDRVIIGSVPLLSADATVCGIITKTGAPVRDGFVGCIMI